MLLQFLLDYYPVKPLPAQGLFISSITLKAPKCYPMPGTLKTPESSGVSVLLEGKGKDWEWLGWWLCKEVVTDTDGS